jgi:hypothetical protein
MFPNRQLRLALFEAAAKAEPLIAWHAARPTVVERQRSEHGVCRHAGRRAPCSKPA